MFNTLYDNIIMSVRKLKINMKLWETLSGLINEQLKIEHPGNHIIMKTDKEELLRARIYWENKENKLEMKNYFRRLHDEHFFQRVKQWWQRRLNLMFFCDIVN